MAVVLVRPLYPGNVGSVARVMKNLGFNRLSIVSDHDPRAAPECGWMADHARDVLEQASLAGSLDEALQSARLVVGTTSRRGARWREAIDPEGLVDLIAGTWQGRPVTILFGPEDRGLSVRELSWCRWVVRIPTTGDYPSMNLSHAVCLVCYVLARGPGGLRAGASGAPAAGKAGLRSFLDEVEGFLDGIGFFRGDPVRSHAVMRRIEALLVRAVPSRADSAMLWALLRYLQRRCAVPEGSLDEG